jgi:serine/threonine-protein kinase
VRARIALLMRTLWPNEPARSRSEFARLLREGRETLSETSLPAATPDAGPVSQAMAKALTPDDPSMVLGTPYKLLRKIGEGASGVVWEAEHVELGRRVALKILAPEHASSAAAVERFRREARAVARLSHPNLVQILDFGKSLDGRTFLAMELLAGETLDATLKRGPMPWREAVRIGVEAASALVAAHAAGLVHRDIKPQNLFLTKAGEVRLLDFGVAMALTEGSDRKPSDKEKALRGFAIFGTPEFMAPEQIAGDTIDGRTDVYALGCVLYEMLTGTRAFQGSSSVVIMGKQLRDTPRAPRVQAGDRAIPATLDAAVMRAMKKVPAERFGSADELRAALQETVSAPARRSASVRRFASKAMIGLAMLAAAVGSAQWARTHTPSLESSLVAAAVPVPASVPAPAPAPAPATATATATATAMVQPPPSPVPLREARAAAHAHPGDPKALENWTRAAFRAGDLREARRAAAAWELRDGTLEPRLVLAEILDASSRRSEARAIMQEWLESHPDSSDARAELTKLSSEGGSREIAHR